MLFVVTPSVSFYLSLDSAILYYPATSKKKRREYVLAPIGEGDLRLKTISVVGTVVPISCRRYDVLGSFRRTFETFVLFS